ncbi:MAG: serine/threonine protein phosphatase [Dysosmobacter sp.]|uniref:serine/threonine protein phosphatase n=1 Tax=Dysosmobacter sp. TaxID=2591382 RepID=UPI002845F7C0|nr:serine/threonine protein phosphatase [Dysosmobacter sp.]MDR3982137.1 serine/threonine protein phosphatase [Dysosmobacter sp.]
MNWFRRKKETAVPGTVQLRSGERHPFGMLADYVPLQNGELQLYRAVREAVPVVDAAIYKLIRMTGGVRATCQDAAAQRQLQTFLRTVPTGRGQQGINAFLDCYLDSLLVCGRAIGEIVPARGGRDIAALLCGRADCIDIREGSQPLEFCICGPDETGRMEPLPFQNLLLFTPFHPEAEHPYGVSLIRSLPFLTDILMKIYHTVGVNWERCGNVRFAVTCRDGGNGQAAERSRMLASEWSQAMQETKQGSVRDFVAVGDVDIRVIGGDAPILDSEVPVRQILEQVVAKTGIPPFMLGLSWSSTERMSAQQADLLTTEITAIRRALTPTVERICRLWLRMHGFTCGYEVVWDDINLQDEVEEAKAQLYLEQARKLRIENDAAEGIRAAEGTT